MKYTLFLVGIVLLLSSLAAVMDYSSFPANSAQKSVQSRTAKIEQANNVLPSGLAISQELPDFSTKMVDTNKPFRMNDVDSPTIVVNFWATWCPPCIEEFPNLLKLARRNQDKLKLVFISVDNKKEAIDAFVRKIGKKDNLDDPTTPKMFDNLSNVTMLWDPKRDIVRKKFQTYQYPETLVIGPDRRITGKYVGVLTGAHLKEIERTATRNLQPR